MKIKIYKLILSFNKENNQTVPFVAKKYSETLSLKEPTDRQMDQWTDRLLELLEVAKKKMNHTIGLFRRTGPIK